MALLSRLTAYLKASLYCLYELNWFSLKDFKETLFVMSQHRALARRYRPNTFGEVLGQDAIVTTLRNAIQYERLAQAYLFSGSHGTGKTTLARVLAKALNCSSKSDHHEPCNECSSCKEITAGNSLDVLEIDGASHRGIEDIRKINDTVAYRTSSGNYKIYIIDEVHMLTKEAFNALLKTLEEPPAGVKFFFATTEPHKVLPTILSRCQQFNLNRISQETIVEKLKHIANDLKVTTSEEALRMIASRADGGLRDAESLLDQILAFHEGEITIDSVSSVLGMMSRDSFFALDQAGKKGDLAYAFNLAHQVFSQGKDLVHYIESLTQHFRNLLLVKVSGKDIPFLSLSDTERKKYEESAKLYRQEQCLDLLDYLIEAQNQVRFMPSGRIALEAILLHIIRSHKRLPVDFLVKRLFELEKNLATLPDTPFPSQSLSPKPLEKSSSTATPPTPSLAISSPPPVAKANYEEPSASLPVAPPLLSIFR